MNANIQKTALGNSQIIVRMKIGTMCEYIDFDYIDKRDKFKCQYCGGDIPRQKYPPYSLVSKAHHHVISFNDNGNHLKNNIILVHQKCHTKIHAYEKYILNHNSAISDAQKIKFLNWKKDKIQELSADSPQDSIIITSDILQMLQPNKKPIKFNPNDECLLSKKQVAERLGFRTYKAVNKLIKMGRLKNVAGEGFSCKFRLSAVLAIIDKSFNKDGEANESKGQ